MTDLSVIIPSFKSAALVRKNIPYLKEFLLSTGYRFEIIVVDDGSEDNGDTKRAAEEHGCVYLENERNLGKGAAVRKGMLHSKSRMRIFTDADIPFENDSLKKFLHYLDVKEFDIVIGDRTLKESTYFTEISKNRKLGSSIFTFLVGRFVTTGLFDTQCGLKGFRGEVADDLFSVSTIDGFAFDVELLYVALKRNYDIKRLPVKFRNAEGSSVSLLRHGITMVGDLARLKFNHLIGKYNRS